MTEKQYAWLMKWKNWHIACELSTALLDPDGAEAYARHRIEVLEKDELYAPWKPYKKKVKT